MDEAARDRRRRWIAWSMRPELRPLALAAVVRARAGTPPPVPASPADLAVDYPFRGSDRRWLTSREPDMASAIRLEATIAGGGDSVFTPEEGGWLEKLWNELEDPPPALYVRGRLHKPEEPAVAIVGARHASEGGLVLARSIARDLACAGVTIVSGLALGIDGASHRGALDAGGRTIAVLAGGIDRPSPPSHTALASRILASGGLVSEFPPGTDPKPLHFPRRNRILAALASIVLIVEGRERSGARSTVDHALALGREVAGVPRDPIHEGSVLPNSLLQTGAMVVTSASDLLPLLGIEPSAPITGSSGATQTSFLDETDRAVLRGLRSGSRPLDSLARTSGRAPAEVLASVGRLELAGLVRRLHGSRYERVGPSA